VTIDLDLCARGAAVCVTDGPSSLSALALGFVMGAVQKLGNFKNGMPSKYCNRYSKHVKFYVIRY
jgi:hypothetical protein